MVDKQIFKNAVFNTIAIDPSIPQKIKRTSYGGDERIMLNINLLTVNESYDSNNTIENTINYIFRLDNSLHFIYGVFPPDKDEIINLYEYLRSYLPQNTCSQQVQHLIFSIKGFRCRTCKICSYSFQIKWPS